MLDALLANPDKGVACLSGISDADPSSEVATVLMVLVGEEDRDVV